RDDVFTAVRELRSLARLRGGFGLRGHLERKLDPEARALAFAALESNRAAEKLGQRLGDRRAETCAAKAAAVAVIGLLERLEDARLRGFRDADAGIAHREAQQRTRFPHRADAA